ncbi:MAG: HaeIII family restriction endonuclease [Candidatus Dojkabacteria bacterium]
MSAQQGKALLESINNLGKNKSYLGENSSLSIAKRAFDKLDEKLSLNYEDGCKKATNYIVNNDSFFSKRNCKQLLEVRIQDDSKGKISDVRDVICFLLCSEYSIGFSIKHNHRAVKHSRLSPKLVSI